MLPPKTIAALSTIGAAATLIVVLLNGTAPFRGRTGILPVEEPGVAGISPGGTGILPVKASGGWVVKVDGWEIEFDSAAATTLPTLNRALERRPAMGPALPFRSQYDDLIVKHANRAGIDWRLVSALISVESGYRHEVTSPSGAYGLMQIREIAARDVGESYFWTPESNIRTGVRYIQRLAEMYPEIPGRDRLAMVLAAYNVGPGHIDDARKLALRYGYNPDRWYDSLERILPLLEEPAIYGRLANGYARASETLEYVERILDRYDRHCLASVAG